MKHLTKHRSRANTFPVFSMAMDARERLFPEPDLTACYHGGCNVNGVTMVIIEIFRGSESIGYVREGCDIIT